MDWSTRSASPQRHLAGIGVVVALHLVAVYALMHGLGRKTVDAVLTPVETRIVDEVAPPPPPERIVPPPAPPPPKPVAAPPPPQRPPPAPPRAAVPPAPTAQPPQVPTVHAAPPSPLAVPAPAPAPAPVEAPPAPPAPPPAPPAPAPPAPAPAVTQSIGVACPGYQQVLRDAGLPREAERAGVDSGEVLIEFTLMPDGEVRDVRVVSSTDRLLDRGSVQSVRRLQCKGQPREVRVQLPISYRPS